MHDLRVNEWVALAPLAALMLVMGVAPNLWMKAIEHMEGPLTIQQVTHHWRAAAVRR